ncbi:MAG: hypothetical protein MUO99_05655, partial [Dehalococcoidales bacterium]|nr:hypothetical protein [Dehalococcoidales bacterium]
MPEGLFSAIDLTLSGTGVPGSQVTVTVALANIAPMGYAYAFKITGYGIGIPDFEIPWRLVPGYGVAYFTTTFTMPNQDCVVSVRSWCLTAIDPEVWVQDTLDTRVIYKAGGVTPTLTLSNTNPRYGDTVSYNFVGFQANALVTLTCRNASGTILGSTTKTADASGAGTGTLYVNL